MTKRIEIKLEKEEYREFRRLDNKAGEAFKFWKKIAAKRELDYRTFVSTNGITTGLPSNNKKHWCWPLKLKCQKTVAEVLNEISEIELDHDGDDSLIST